MFLRPPLARRGPWLVARIERAHHADARQHGVVAVRGYEQERLDRGLSLRCLVPGRCPDRC
ncbi:MAG TPA: hypothetical protein VNY06_05750 [Methylocella sp.]|nr:hypothetical protein [Methylocella sp.]